MIHKMGMEHTPRQRVDRIFEEAVGSDLSSWEKFEFLPNIRAQATLSPKQEEILQKIEARVFDLEDD